MSPELSWVLFGVCIAIGAWVYVAVVGGRRYQRMEGQALDWPTPEPPLVRILGGIYDHEASGDFR